MNEKRPLNDAAEDFNLAPNRKMRLLSNDDASVVKTWSCVQPRVIPFSHEWTILDFNFFRPIGETVMIESPVFQTSTEDCTAKWILKLYCFEGDISLDLKLISTDNNRSVMASFNFAVFNAKLEKIISRRAGCFKFETEGRGEGFNNFLMKKVLFDEENGLLSTLTIKCDIYVYAGENVHISSQSHQQSSVCNSNKLAHQLKSVLEEKRMSDVTLSVGDQEFPAHKVILAARSPVFAAMFQNDMLEGRQNKATIVDDPKVLEEMLVFIYTDECPNLKNMAVDLLIAADKYDLPGLKQMCEEFLYTTITVDNASKILSLADQYNAEHLKNLAITYISSQATCLMKTRAWKDLLVKNAESIEEAFQQASE